jgi:hypothetical protein
MGAMAKKKIQEINISITKVYPKKYSFNPSNNFMDQKNQAINNSS